MVISGSVASGTRMKIVEKFNNQDVQVLIITLAGSEGLDLKGTRNIIILDPVWNPAIMEQITGRGIRYKSHVHLPADERHVDIYHVLLKSLSFDVPSGDEILYGFIEQKAEIWKDVIKVLQDASINLDGSPPESQPIAHPKSKTPPKSPPKSKPIKPSKSTVKDLEHLMEFLMSSAGVAPPTSAPPLPLSMPQSREGYTFERGRLIIDNRQMTQTEFEIVLNKVGRENIDELACSGCKKITEIINLPRVHTIYCSGSEKLREIIGVPMLKRLHCVFTPKLYEFILGMSVKDFKRYFPKLLECDCCAKFRDELLDRNLP